MNTTPTIDLRSDTVTRPSSAMRRAMAEAEVGDDVLDGDPTTRALEERVAALFGCEAGLFLPSGTQANQVGINVLTSPGTEIVCDSNSHIVQYEKAGLAALSGVQPRTVVTATGSLTPDDIRSQVSESRYLPRVSAVAMENSHNMAGGTVMTEAEMAAVSACARELGLAVHLDGARSWNAAAAAGFELQCLGCYADTIMACFSKGLGCPVGSCLVGTRALIDEAWHVRKRFGGGMRQSGVLAAACLYALDHVLPRISDDHEAARRFAAALEGHPAVQVNPPATNIVIIELHRHTPAEALDLLRRVGVLLVPVGPSKLRAVTHLDVSLDEAIRAGGLVGEVLNGD